MAMIGEEVCSLIIDAGAKYIRVGYSGDERPTVIMPSHVGVLPDGRPVFGDLALAVPRPGMEVRPTVGAAEVLDWKLFEALLSHAVVEILGAKWSEYPVFYIENPAWPRESRERLVQLFFDKFEVPALYLGRAPVMAAFAMGKHAALVVDCGASAVRVGAVVDGQMLKASSQQEILLGGAELTRQCRAMLGAEAKLSSITISQQVEGKRAVELSQPAQADIRMLADATESYLTYQQDLVLDDFKASVVQISEAALDGQELARRPPKYYEFPDGYNSIFVVERYRLGEQLFQPKQFRYHPEGTAAATEEEVSGLTDLIKKCIERSDPDVRQALISNLILTGGGSSLHGLSERLNYELAHNQGAFSRARVQISPSSQERWFGPWIGGSILASLGTFQQLWFTRQEYKELGAGFVEQKCL